VAVLSLCALALVGPSPRSPPSAASEGRSRVRLASWWTSPDGCRWQSWGLPASRCSSRSREGGTARARRCRSSTSPTAEGEPRGSLLRLQRSACRQAAWIAAITAGKSRATSSALTRRAWGPNRTQLDEWCAARPRIRRLRTTFSRLVRVSRRPVASRRMERVRTQATLVATRTMRSDPPTDRRGAAVGAPTSGAAGVGRAPGARSAKREHAGPCCDVKLRGNPTHVRRKPASGGPPARGAQRARRAVSRRTTAGQPHPARGARSASTPGGVATWSGGATLPARGARSASTPGRVARCNGGATPRAPVRLSGHLAASRTARVSPPAGP